MSPSGLSQCYRARYVFTGTGPPLSSGVVEVRGDEIVRVCEATDESDQAVEDLGPIALIPAFVNAHSHLEFSDLSEPIEAGDSFPEWIRAVIGLRRSKSEISTAPVIKGLEELLQQGTALIGEIATSDWSPDPFSQSVEQAVVFLELLGLTADKIEPNLELAEKHAKRRRKKGAWHPGLSPHAPYSVHPKLFEGVVQIAVEKELPVAMHLAESREELELLRTGKGPFRDLLEQLGAWEPGVLPTDRKPLHYLEALAKVPKALVIHGNYLDASEMDFLAQHRNTMTVVYCPRTHKHFGHREHPIRDLLEQGVRVAVGTDSRASTPDLSLLSELQHIAKTFPALEGNDILKLGTLAGAEALGFEKKIGTIEPGKQASFAVIGLPAYDARDPHELLWDTNSQVVGSMIAGEWIHPIDPKLAPQE